MKKMDKIKPIIMGVVLIIAVVCVFLYMNYFRTYTVTFDAKIGPGVQAQEVKIGKRATEPDDLTYDGYTFLGWYLDDQIYDFETPVKKDITLTAKWEKIEQ